MIIIFSDHSPGKWDAHPLYQHLSREILKNMCKSSQMAETIWIWPRNAKKG